MRIKVGTKDGVIQHNVKHAYVGAAGQLELRDEPDGAWVFTYAPGRWLWVERVESERSTDER